MCFNADQFFRRRRKRRDQVADGKEKPQNFNLPQIPHCYSAAASLAASSLAHKFSDGPSLGSIDDDVAMTRDEDEAISDQYNVHHATDGSGSNNPADVDLHQTPQLNPIQENTQTVPNQPRQKPSRPHEIQPLDGGEHYIYHTQHQSAPIGDGRLAQTVGSTVLPEFRTLSSQAQFEVPRYPSFSSISNYPSTFAQPTSSHYTTHYPLGQGIPSSGPSLPSHSHLNPQASSQFSNQRHFNFSVNQLIQRPYPKM